MTTEPDDPLPLLDAPEPEKGRRVVRCRCCGRPLRGRAARLRGVGDGCWAKLAERTAPRPARSEVEQDGLPGV
jgi:Family of unknown function (DUF6011)